MNRALTPTQELELLSALESRAESPLKFAYIGEGYEKWVRYARKSREDHQVQYEEDVLKKDALPFIFRGLNEKTRVVNIIDFGCGDGVPILPVIEHVKKVGRVRYIPVDISQRMLDLASATVKEVLQMSR